MTRRFFGLTAAAAALSPAENSSDLNLSLAAVTADAAPGAPVTLRATIETRKGDVSGVPDISPESGNFELWLLNLSNGERTQYTGPGWNASESKPESHVIKATEPLVKDLTVGLPPGRYQFNLQYKGLGLDNPLYAQTSLTVHPPASAAETAWWQALQADPALAESLQRLDFTGRDSAAKTAESLLQAHHHAPQASAAGLGLGKLYLHGRKDPNKALQFLRVAVQLAADSGIRAQALLEAFDALTQSGATNEAASVLAQAAAEAKDSALVREIRSRKPVKPSAPPPAPWK